MKSNEDKKEIIEKVKERYLFLGIGVEPKVYAENYIITYKETKSKVRYTIRKIDDDGNVAVFGGLHRFTTRMSAEQWLLGS